MWICDFDVCVLVTQSCPTLCDPMDCSPQRSSVHGILQARILEWVAIPLSKGSFQPRDQIQVFLHWQADSLPSEPPGRTQILLNYFPCGLVLLTMLIRNT